MFQFDSSSSSVCILCPCAAKVVELKAEAGKGYSLAELTAAVEEHKPAALFLVHGESSTGVQQSLAGGDLQMILSRSAFLQTQLVFCKSPLDAACSRASQV